MLVDVTRSRLVDTFGEDRIATEPSTAFQGGGQRYIAVPAGSSGTPGAGLFGDVPGLPDTRAGDLLQAFWCPFERHGESRHEMYVEPRWRPSQGTGTLLRAAGSRGRRPPRTRPLGLRPAPRRSQ